MTLEDPRILELRKIRAKALEGGGEERINKQKAKGKLTARERVITLLDAGTFNEIEPFITHQGDEMNNFILMHAMGANTAGQLGSVIAEGILLSVVSKMLGIY